jgi:hypothetical protein
VVKTGGEAQRSPCKEKEKRFSPRPPRLCASSSFSGFGSGLPLRAILCRELPIFEKISFSFSPFPPFAPVKVFVLPRCASVSLWLKPKNQKNPKDKSIFPASSAVNFQIF